MKTMIKSVRGALLAVAALAVAAPAMAAGEAPHIERQQWSFSGPFGQYDKAQLQRGFKVYKEVCASCHGASFMAFRNLSEPGGPGFTEDQVKAVAAEYTVMKGPNDDGEMEEVAAIPSDRWPSPFPNQQAARAANGGAYPPDFSTLAKARAVASGFPGFIFDMFTQYQEHGPDYIYNLLTGYEDPPEGVEVPAGQYYNPKFIAGQTLAMAPPLFADGVEYTDGTPTTVEQYAKDVSAFMMWVAEPKLEERKRMGFRVMIFLIVFASLLYFTKKSVWRDVDH